ncbi:MAG: hypothetical protein ACLVKA_08760 [Collinsella aerofaciens]
MVINSCTPDSCARTNTSMGSLSHPKTIAGEHESTGACAGGSVNTLFFLVNEIATSLLPPGALVSEAASA